MVKWGGLVVTVLLVGVWIGSGWWGVLWESPTRDHWFAIRDGCVFLGMRDSNPSPFPGWEWGPSESPGTFDWRMDWDDIDWDAIRRPHLWFKIPLWLPAAVMLSSTGCAWLMDSRARRRTRLNICPKCRYDRAGLAAGAACPECGAPPAPVNP
jgi:hypothetical protein